MTASIELSVHATRPALINLPRPYRLGGRAALYGHSDPPLRKQLHDNALTMVRRTWVVATGAGGNIAFPAATGQAGKYRIPLIALPRQATSANTMPRP